MPSFSLPASFLLRACVFLMLVAGVFVRPVLNHVGELHGLQHVAQASAEHGHPHAGDREAADQDQTHVDGLHGLLHQADVTGTVGILVGALLSEPAVGTDIHPWHRPSAELHHHRASLFRPPIA